MNTKKKTEFGTNFQKTKFKPANYDKNYAITARYKATPKQAEVLAKRFGEDNVIYKDGYVTINHTMIGWSHDNHNVDDAILTAYSSETTAHILDAVKKGAVPNVNEFTFAVYKTLFVNFT